MTDEILRARYKELKTKASAIYAEIEPKSDALHEEIDKLWEPYDAVSKEIDELLDKAGADTCKSCDEPILFGDARYPTDGGNFLCILCAPTYHDMLILPGRHVDEAGDTLTPEKAKIICDEYVANGGNLSDSMAVVPEEFEES
jgi:hypothetical protein